MSEKVATQETENVKAKKVRRGISNETKSVSQLKFNEKDAASNGLFVGCLEEVIVDWRTLKEDVKGLPSFAGLSIPRLVFHFTSLHQNVSEKRHVYHTLLPIESNVDTIPGGQYEWQVNNAFAWIKHILTIFYLKNRQFTDAEEEALSLSFEDFDEQGQYVSVDPEDVIKGYQALFENAAAMLNGQFNLPEGETAKPCYKDANGKPLKIWMKLLRYQKRKNEWKPVGQNGELAFPSFIGEGVIELVKGANVPPSILNFSSAVESITYKETKKAPNLGVAGGMPNMMGGALAGGIPGNPMGGDFNPSGFDGSAAGAYAAAGESEDLPF